jgi:hypothetical protein
MGSLIERDGTLLPGADGTWWIVEVEETTIPEHR